MSRFSIQKKLGTILQKKMQKKVAKKKITFLLVILILCSSVLQTFANTQEFSKESFLHDQQLLKITRQGLAHIIQFMQINPDLFPPDELKKKRLLQREQRTKILITWRIFLQHIYTLDVLGQKYNIYYQQTRGKQDKHKAFQLAYAAFLTQYRYALDFITLCEKDPTLHTVLNEADIDHALNSGLYKEIKFRFLNVLRGIEFARLEVIYKLYHDKNPPITAVRNSTDIETAIAEDSKVIWQAGKGRGPKQTAKNAMRIVKDTFFTSWFPVQKEVSEWMGDTKVFRVDKNLISPAQIKAMQQQLQPGDILIERREWYLSNLGLPGYWSHAALYIGTAKERRAYFDTPEVHSWLEKHYTKNQAKDLEDLLQKRFPKAYQISLKEHEGQHLPRVIEAISEGVSFTTLEYSAGADSIAVLRPRLDKTAKADAIVRAFSFSGKPYDFNFDFITDNALVCTEVIYKAYEPTSKQAGLNLPIGEILGRKAITANDFIKLFALEYETEQQQLDFIIFLDGYERRKKAIKTGVDSLRESWLRPNWHILVQDTRLEK